MKKAVLFLVIVGSGAAYYHYFYIPRKRLQAALEVAYVLPDSLPVVDTTAMIRNVLVTYHSGQAVRVEARIGEWAKLMLPSGETGWVKQDALMSSADYEQGQALIKGLESREAQAEGHTSEPAHLRLGPSRTTLDLGQFNKGQAVKVYDRRWVLHAAQNGVPGTNARGEAWYLVTGSGRGGWTPGRLINLDIPSGLSAYAQGINMVAWLVLDTVNDNGQQVPQYIAADRIGVENFDFDHIRVFTWWVKRHEYVTAYVESGVDGYFPITVSHEGGIPYFRLRLVDEDGDKFQKVYGLYDTIVRPLGTVEGWESTAMPAAPQTKRRRPRRGRLQR